MANAKKLLNVEGQMGTLKLSLATICVVAVFAFTSWLSFCAGVYFSTRGTMLNQAQLEMSNARLEVTLLDAVQAGNFQRSNDILRQRTEFAIFQHDYILSVTKDLTIWTYLLHPFDTFDAVFFTVNAVNPPSDAEISNLRARIGTWSNSKK
jgi:hypothetical protein